MVAKDLKCHIFEEGVKDQYSEVYGLSCKGEDTSIAQGYNWVLSKVPPCTLTYEEQCKIDKYISNLKKDYICTTKEECNIETECVLTVTIIEPIRQGCRLTVAIV